MLTIKAKSTAALIGRATKKSPHVFRCPVYPGLPFHASVLIFKFVVEKTGLRRREDLFGWSSPILGYTSKFINCPRVPMDRKFGKPWYNVKALQQNTT